MAKYKPPRQATTQEMRLVGSEDVLATFADVFVVANEGEAGLSSIYFYQRQLPFDTAVMARTLTQKANKAKCVARIVLSPAAIQKLLEGIAENRGFIITPKGPKQEDQQ